MQGTNTYQKTYPFQLWKTPPEPRHRSALQAIVLTERYCAEVRGRQLPRFPNTRTAGSITSDGNPYEPNQYKINGKAPSKYKIIYTVWWKKSD